MLRIISADKETDVMYEGTSLQIRFTTGSAGNYGLFAQRPGGKPVKMASYYTREEAVAALCAIREKFLSLNGDSGVFELAEREPDVLIFA